MGGRYIDADKLKAHYAWWKGGTREMTMDEAKSDFDTIIDLQPTVEAEPIEVRATYEQKAYSKGLADGYAMILMDFDKDDPTKHGRWEAHEGYSKCLNCNTLWYNETPYCPNCGARMDEVEE